jgi:hypothetical protein
LDSFTEPEHAFPHRICQQQLQRNFRCESGLLALVTGRFGSWASLARERCFHAYAGALALLEALPLEGGAQPNVPQTHVPDCSIRH